MKKFLAGLITGIIIAISFTTYAAVQLKVIPNPYPIFINNTKANVQGYNINGSTYLKLADLKTAGLDVKFADKKINVTSAFATSTDVGKNPNIDYSDIEAIKKMNPTTLVDGDSFTLTTYKGYSALVFNGNTYISILDLSKKKDINSKPTGEYGAIKLYRGKELILETKDADSINYLYYNKVPYFNVKFLGKYLED